MKPKQKKKEIISPEECKRIRRIWLIDEELSQLSKKLMKTSIHRTRAIVKPWKLKGRTKVDFIKAVISYIKTQRGWVSLEI